MLDDFHFTRPLWLLGAVVIPILAVLLWRIKSSAQQWRSIIDSELLSHLMQGQTQRLSKLPLTGLCLFWLIAFIAMAGPSWQKLPQPQFVNQQPLVLLVDLSPSMAVQDIKPSRLVKMRFKLIDFLKARKQGLTALVVYAGDAHVLAPLSEDNATLISLIPTLSPGVMPVQGSNTEEGIALAISLLENQGYQDANIMLFTDGITPKASSNVNALLKETNYQLSILGVGTEEGAPIPIIGQGFAKDELGNIVLAKVNTEQLSVVATNNRGIYTPMSIDNLDIERLLTVDDKVAKSYQKLEEKQALGDQWEDAGQWLLLLLIPLALLSFRRGWLLQLAVVSVLMSSVFNPQQAMAFQWQDLWETDNQQGAKLFQKQQYAKAAAKFEDQPWRGVAQFKAEDYKQAASSFLQQNTADGYYNQGNALAHSNALREALVAYDKALLLDPNMQDAILNKALVTKLLELQAEDQQNSDQQQSKDKSAQPQKQQQEGNKGDDAEDQQSEKPNSDSSDPSQDENSTTAADQQNQQDASAQQEPSAKQDSGTSKQQNLDELKSDQQQQQQQALEKLAEQQKQPAETAAGNDDKQVAESVKMQEKTPSEQQLENWLGQLPEDASTLVRNKFRYEYQKKRQAYLNGQWQPPKEQRW